MSQFELVHQWIDTQVETHVSVSIGEQVVDAQVAVHIEVNCWNPVDDQVEEGVLALILAQVGR